MMTLIPSSIILALVATALRKFPLLKPIFYVFLTISVTVIAESTLHKIYHEERETLTPQLLIGKAAVLTTNNEFIKPKQLDIEENRLLTYIDDFYQPYEDWLSTKPNRYLVKDLNTEMEAFTQMQLLDVLEVRYESVNYPSHEQMKNIGM